jgi:hypothetical protein
MGRIVTSVKVENFIYLVREQSQAAVDMLGRRLIHVKRLDLKRG